MATILQVETATEVCSVAVSRDGQLLSLKEELNCRDHIVHITRLIEACLEEVGVSFRQLDAVAVSSGPGSYTSLRTGVSTAKGLCYALDIPLIAIDTLTALAAAAFEQPGIPDGAVCIPMLDARRNEVWLSAYNKDLNPYVNAQPLLLETGVLDAWLTSLSLDFMDVLVISGNGQEKINSSNIGNNAYIRAAKSCSARSMTRIAEKKFGSGAFEQLASFEPYYMKPPNITQSAKVNL
jgi:tRNA threonylcarbamoyladenosine biosynthesis protein TsaB